jgi:hypothetical protein
MVGSKIPNQYLPPSSQLAHLPIPGDQIDARNWQPSRRAAKRSRAKPPKQPVSPDSCRGQQAPGSDKTWQSSRTGARDPRGRGAVWPYGPTSPLSRGSGADATEKRPPGRPGKRPDAVDIRAADQPHAVNKALRSRSRAAEPAQRRQRPRPSASLPSNSMRVPVKDGLQAARFLGSRHGARPTPFPCWSAPMSAGEATA